MQGSGVMTMKATVSWAALALAAGLGASLPAAAQTAGAWTGAYVGGHLGYGFQPGDGGERVLFDTDLNGSYGDTVRTGAGVDAFSPGFCGGTAKGRTPGEGCNGDDDGVDVGIRAGYDLQYGSFLVGALAELSYLDVQDGVAAFSTTPASYSFSRELEFLAALRLRAGVATDRFLVYATGGLAWGDVDSSFQSTNTANAFLPRGDKGAWGWQLGAGAEAKLNQTLSVGLEYLYTRLDDDRYVVRTARGTAPATNPFLLVNPDGTDMRRGDSDFSVNTVRLTVTYRFGG